MSYIDEKHLSQLNRIFVACRELGIDCLDNEWQGMKAHYRFRCAQGHEYSCQGRALLSSNSPARATCPECCKSNSLARLKAMAIQRGGECLELNFLGAGVPHRFRCAHGHEWSAIANSVTSGGSWCQHCAIEKRKINNGLERLRLAAKLRGGICLATEYRGMRQYYAFRCAKGHEWSTTGENILAVKNWCPHCAHAALGKQLQLTDGLDRLRAAALAKGGECLSKEYLGQAQRYRFRCSKGHEWETAGQNVLYGYWCRKCFFENTRDGIEKMHEIARARGGRCLSTKYVTSHHKLTWECHRGHVWRTTPATVKQGCWCPTCAQMNQITNRKSKARLKYMRTSNGDRIK
jgi:hypothetical protein